MTKKLTLTRGLVTVVDDEDYERLSAFRWAADASLNVIPDDADC